MNSVYPPAEDSELLLEVAAEEVRGNDEVLEIGVGSGFVSSRLIGRCKLVIGTDISPHAVREAKSKGVEVIRTYLARGIKRKFSLILFNPPYLELDDLEKRGDWLEKAIDGGRYGVEVISRFIDEAGDFVRDDGRIILIVSSHNLPFIKEKLKSRFYFRIAGRKKVFFEEILALRLKKKK